jgi:hypothetical protein
VAAISVAQEMIGLKRERKESKARKEKTFILPKFLTLD